MFSKKTMLSFASKYEVNTETQCWEWTASFARGGYGQFSTSVLDGRQWYRAHRFSYIAHNGDISEGQVVMHLCDNPKCVNPEHLSCGTQAENISHREAKGRGKWNVKLQKTRQKLEYILASAKSDTELATEFSCSPAHIWKIRNGKYAWCRNSCRPTKVQKC